MECEISLSEDLKNYEKGLRFKVLEEGAVQLSVLYVFLQEPSSTRKEKEGLVAVNALKISRCFLHEAATLSQFLACCTQQTGLPQLQSFSVISMNKEVTAPHTSRSD